MALADVALFDWIALGIFTFCTLVYHFGYYLISERVPMKTVRGKIHRYRRDWVEGVIKTRNYIMAVQAVRNLIMTTTFLASSMLLVMAFIFNYIITGRLERRQEDQATADEAAPGTTTGDEPLFRLEHGELFGFKVYLLLGLFVFAFLSFLLAIRLLNQFSVLIGVSPELIAQVEGLDPADYLAHILNMAASRHTYGLRAAYFAIPAGAWLFSTEAFVALTLGIWFMLVFVLDSRNVLRGGMVKGSVPPAQPAGGAGAGPPTSAAAGAAANPPPKTG